MWYWLCSTIILILADSCLSCSYKWFFFVCLFFLRNVVRVIQLNAHITLFPTYKHASLIHVCYFSLQDYGLLTVERPTVLEVQAAKQKHFLFTRKDRTSLDSKTVAQLLWWEHVTVFRRNETVPRQNKTAFPNGLHAHSHTHMHTLSLAKTTQTVLLTSQDGYEGSEVWYSNPNWTSVYEIHTDNAYAIFEGGDTDRN